MCKCFHRSNQTKNSHQISIQPIHPSILEPSCCEATILITAPSCHPQHQFYKTFSILICITYVDKCQIPTLLPIIRQHSISSNCLICLNLWISTMDCYLNLIFHIKSAAPHQLQNMKPASNNP